VIRGIATGPAHRGTASYEDVERDARAGDLIGTFYALIIAISRRRRHFSKRASMLRHSRLRKVA
jgi:hypothetical protein